MVGCRRPQRARLQALPKRRLMLAPAERWAHHLGGRLALDLRRPQVPVAMCGNCPYIILATEDDNAAVEIVEMPKGAAAKTGRALRKRVTALKSSRIEMRVTAAQKRLFERAAAASGMSLTDFAVISLQATAKSTLDNQSRTVVAPEYAAAFVEAMVNPPEPNERLRQAAKRYFARVGR